MRHPLDRSSSGSTQVADPFEGGNEHSRSVNRKEYLDY
jgi:hypothetical protein